MSAVQSRLRADPVAWAVESFLLYNIADKMAAGNFPEFLRTVAAAYPVIEDIAKHDPLAGEHVRKQVRVMWDLNTAYLTQPPTATVY